MLVSLLVRKISLISFRSPSIGLVSQIDQLHNNNYLPELLRDRLFGMYVQK